MEVASKPAAKRLTRIRGDVRSSSENSYGQEHQTPIGFLFVPSQTTSLEEIVASIRSCGLQAEHVDRGVLVDGERIILEVVERAHPTPADLARLSAELAPAVEQGLFVLADRISEAGREVLRSAGASWLDRRGHLRLWMPGLRLEMPFTPVERPRPRPVTTFTPAVRDVVFSILLEPGLKPSPRRLGGILERSPGYVSTILTALAEDGLLDNDGHALLPELFWALVDVWPRDWVLLSDDLDTVKAFSPGGIVSGVHAAAFWGAPVLVGEGETVQLCVAGQREMRRVLEHSTSAVRRHKARVAVRELGPSSRSASLVIDGEVVAHPLLCALDLGADQRSRETLEGWRATSSSLGAVAFIEVIQRTVYRPDRGWLRAILRRELSVEVAESLVSWCWSDPECLALLWQNPKVPFEVRTTIRPRVDELALVDERSLEEIVRAAPNLLAEDFYRKRFPHPKKPLSSQLDDLVEWEITHAFLSTRDKVSRAIEKWAEKLARKDQSAMESEVSGVHNPWLRSEVSGYLLRWTEHSELSAELIEQLRIIESAVDTIQGLSFYSSRWLQGSDFSNPAWKVLGEKIAGYASLSPARIERLLGEALELPLVDQAVPLCELLRVANAKLIPKLLMLVSGASQAVADLHLRARVLAAASAFAPSAEQRNEFLNAALVAGRAAVHETSSSLLGGPAPGGVSGLLHVVAFMSGPPRRALLSEIVRLWSQWVDPNIDDKRKSIAQFGRGRDHLFSGGGWDPTEPLIRWLVEENMTADLQRIFKTIRHVQGEPSNALEVMLAHTASPGLLGGDVETCALFVSEARNPSPSERHRQIDRDNNSGSECPFEMRRFPDELVGFRNVWR